MIPGTGRNHPSFRRSFLFALQGFRTAVATERNIKVMLGGFVFAVVMGIILRIDAIGWACVLICCGAVIVTELVNTAIETIVDLVSPEFHPLAGRAKDIAAAASWTMSLTSVLVGLIVYGRALLALLG
ncbi:MAG: diacylglycerol kinase family protein [Atopobiaceae bacterium]|nr:diacylglycerol kinase family protein [Atopobiaceae bacterium]